MSEERTNWLARLGWFYGEPLQCLPTPGELGRDPAYRPICAVGLLSLLAGLLLSIIARPSSHELSPLSRLLLSVMPYQVFALGGCLLGLIPMIRREGFRLSLQIPQPSESPGVLVGFSLRFLLLIYPVILAINAFSLYFCRLLEIPLTPPAIEALGQEGGLLYWMVSGISSVIMAPIVEEILIRLVIFRCIRSICPLWAAIFSSMVFSLMHGNPQYVLSLFFVGMCLQHAMALGGLPRAILLHSLYNLLAFTILCLQHCWG